ncbi:MAG: NUDIX hydrolase [Chloroflexi bacterium]|nr:MAG: NUDIX hydrolase [Chloroflexota bacterium]
MFYTGFKILVSVFFNLLNLLMGGNLPPFTCVCVVVEDQGRYLIVRRPKGDLVLPGGFMCWHERPEQTACRECKEETGLDIQPGEFISYTSLVSKRFDHMSTVNIVLQGKVLGGNLHSSIEGFPCWLSKDELQSGQLNYSSRDAFNQYLRLMDKREVKP